MKLRSATLATLLLAASCGGVSGYLSRDTGGVSLRLHSGRPAEITGILEGSLDPVSFLSEASLSGVSCLELAVERNDSVEIADAVASDPNLFAGRLVLAVGSPDRPISISAEQKGFIWAPDVLVSTHGDSFRLAAGVTIRNETGQTWGFDRLEIVDSRDSVLISATQPGFILPGSVTYPWRTLTGRILDPVVSYGFPDQAEWSVIIPVVSCSTNLEGFDVTSGGVAGWTGDTLWLDGGALLDLSVTRNPLPSGYGFVLTISNPGAEPVGFRLRCPARLESGAAVVFDAPHEEELELPGGGAAQVRYRISYTRS